ncbi:hypothetical protein ACGFZG_13525 [Streptomyces antibioticus]
MGLRPRRTVHQASCAVSRYDKTATVYLAGLHLAAIFIWSAQ